MTFILNFTYIFLQFHKNDNFYAYLYICQTKVDALVFLWTLMLQNVIRHSNGDIKVEKCLVGLIYKPKDIPKKVIGAYVKLIGGD